MPYCTYDDLLDQITESDLIALTDDAGFGGVDRAIVDKAIANAAATINDYCQARYPLPLSPVPPRIPAMAADLAIYDLSGRRGMEVPDYRQKRYAAVIRYLEGVRDGKNKLAVAAQEEPAASGQGIVTSTPARLFDAATLAKF